MSRVTSVQPRAPESSTILRRARTRGCSDYSVGQLAVKPNIGSSRPKDCDSSGVVCARIDPLADKSGSVDVVTAVRSMQLRLSRLEGTLAFHDSRIQDFDIITQQVKASSDAQQSLTESLQAACDGEQVLWRWLEERESERKIAMKHVDTKLTTELAMLGKAVETELAQLKSLLERKFQDAMEVTKTVDASLRDLIATRVGKDTLMSLEDLQDQMLDSRERGDNAQAGTDVCGRTLLFEELENKFSQGSSKRRTRTMSDIDCHTTEMVFLKKKRSLDSSTRLRGGARQNDLQEASSSLAADACLHGVSLARSPVFEVVS